MASRAQDRRASPSRPAAEAFDALPMPLAWLDAEMRVVSANAALADLLGATATNLAGVDLAAELRRHALATVTEGEIEAFGFATGDGLRWLKLDLRPADGATLAALVDVTGERRFLDRFRRDYLLRDELMHRVQVGVWRYDPDTEIYYFSSELSMGHDDHPITEPVPLAVLQRIQHPDD